MNLMDYTCIFFCMVNLNDIVYNPKITTLSHLKLKGFDQINNYQTIVGSW